MKILQKYVLREFLTPFAYCFGTFYGLYVLCTLFSTFKKLADAQATAGFVAHFLVAYMSPYVVWLLPASLMLAALYTMWRFCHHGEIVAMRANGLSYATIVTPILAVAAVAAVACTLNQEFYMPRGREFAERAADSNFHPPPTVIRKVEYVNYPARRTWMINRMDFEHPNVLEGVGITIERPDSRRVVEITCHRAEYLDGVWWLYAPQYNYFDAQGIHKIPPPANPLLQLTIRPMPHFNEKPHDFVLDGKEWEYLSVRDMLARLQANPQSQDRAHLYDLHARLALPWSCVVITLFAIPAGIATGRQSVFKGVLLAIALFFGFYLTTLGCALLAKNREIALLPWLAAWLPNLTFLGAGLALFARLR